MIITPYYKRVILIPFGIMLIAITLCWIIDETFILHQFPYKIPPYLICYFLNFGNLTAMTVSCLTAFLNNYTAIRNNVVLSALTWFSGYVGCILALLIVGKVDFSNKPELSPGQILMSMFLLVPLITMLVQFIKYRRSLADLPLHLSS
jgi:hypothetical protein